jgi:L-aspartate oxidase
VAAVSADPDIEVVENALVLDLIKDGQGSAAGVTLHVIGPGRRDGVGAALAPAVVLATGGFGQVFGQTTNPYVSTGDGVALALRAGAAVADVEFVQFHPTVLWLGPLAQGQQPLVSEAVRGEGAVLVDDAGERFMIGEHPMADLAPRDVVAKAIRRRMRQTGAAHMWLDGRRLGADVWVQRFPTILASCRLRGIDPVTDLIPVAPAQHYASGGVLTDLDGRSTIPGLYACGEVACSGVHGANRLASNSLLEGLVFGRRISAAIERDLAGRHSVDEVGTQVPNSGEGLVVANSVRRPMQQAMDKDAGVLRSAKSLTAARDWIDDVLSSERCQGSPCTEDWEATNLLTVARVLVEHASLREETRGSHWREDFPETAEGWRLRLVTTMTADGTLHTEQRTPDWIPASEADR